MNNILQSSLFFLFTFSWFNYSHTFLRRARGVAAGLSAAFDYLLTFISTKSYYNLETLLSMPGIALLNCIITGCGLILMYNIMPETENRTLEDIEFHFSDNSKKLTDRKIARVSSEQLKQAGRDNDDFEATKNGTELERDSNELKNKTRNGCDNRGYVNDI